MSVGEIRPQRNFLLDTPFQRSPIFFLKKAITGIFIGSSIVIGLELNGLIIRYSCLNEGVIGETGYCLYYFGKRDFLPVLIEQLDPDR
ncbi:hypothetical protein [Candidatus Coxiella mudrowiae]|uniref:hypothetical protein n=1 Tax=Candidatus Coxiella mudrowiae TaxID=2054173 RepID=UPI001F3FCC99|nr:hypothetical protein [Candidatus Coxiella mudrowiae]